MKKGRTVLKALHVTEKASMIQGLKDAESNKSLKACKTPKFVFVVDKGANKQEIKQAIEETYKEQKFTITKVNTINLPGKQKRVRGQNKMGFQSGLKKAVVTLKAGDEVDFEM